MKVRNSEKYFFSILFKLSFTCPEINLALENESPECYESPKKKIVSCAFGHLIHNIKTYNGVKM